MTNSYRLLFTVLAVFFSLVCFSLLQFESDQGIVHQGVFEYILISAAIAIPFFTGLGFRSQWRVLGVGLIVGGVVFLALISTFLALGRPSGSTLGWWDATAMLLSVDGRFEFYILVLMAMVPAVAWLYNWFRKPSRTL